MVDKEQEDKPKWLLELENRKRKPKLAHETGAGAPCLTCESACPGLDLHFWRKICKNCKCRGDEHDFDDEEFPQFELLFGPNVKKNKKNRSVLLQVNDKKLAQAETPFEWIPPDTTKELAADYMKALPTDKMPIKGSTGAALRKQQLQKQLPLHDIDHKACDGLSEFEMKEFEKYLDNLKNCAGQGKVSKLMTIRPFDRSLMTPANATDVQQFSPQHSQQLTNPGIGLNLRIPSSFIPKTSLTHGKLNPSNISDVPTTAVASNLDIIKTQQLQALSDINPQLGCYHHALPNISNNSLLAESSNVSGAYHAEGCQVFNSSKENHPRHNSTPFELKYSKNPNYFAKEEHVQNKQDSHLSTNISTPTFIHSKKPEFTTSKTTSNPTSEPNESKINEVKALMEKFGGQVEQNLEFSSDLPSQALLAEQMMPEGSLSPNDVRGSNLNKERLTNMLDKLNSKCSKNQQTPMSSRELDHISYQALISNSENLESRNADRAINIENNHSQFINDNRNQLPSQMPYSVRSEPLHASLNTSLPVQSNVIYSEALNNPVFPEDAIGASVAIQNLDNISQLQEEMEGMTINTNKTHQCHKCEKDIHSGGVVVTAEKIKDAVWHPGCFVCSACDELLVDLVYFTYKGKLYCGRDLAELLEIPRCFACDELIFVREYTVAEGHNYHVKHFCCWDCDIPLAGQQYTSENDRPLCLPCYQNNYAKTCNGCNKVVAADQQGVAIKNLNFHATDECFCCFTCKTSLLGGQVAIRENRLLCSKECIAEFLHRRALGR